MDKLEQYSDVIPRLVQETIACSPGTWTHGTLFVQSDGVRLTYQLKNDASPDRASISDELRNLIEELYMRMRSNQDVWTGASVSWTRNGDDAQFKLSFDYSQK
jgi:ribosome-associated toxin RatA of RatAB toxin-antitoxin module